MTRRKGMLFILFLLTPYSLSELWQKTAEVTFSEVIIQMYLILKILQEVSVSCAWHRPEWLQSCCHLGGARAVLSTDTYSSWKCDIFLISFIYLFFCFARSFLDSISDNSSLFILPTWSDAQWIELGIKVGLRAGMARRWWCWSSRLDGGSFCLPWSQWSGWVRLGNYGAEEKTFLLHFLRAAALAQLVPSPPNR